MGLITSLSVFCVKPFYPLTVYGKENMPNGAAVVTYNHFSSIDCGLIVRTTPKGTSILAKKELFKNKIVSWFIRKFNAIPVDRENPSISTLFAASKVLRENRKLALFPEGTRNKTGSTELLPLKSGCAIFAIKAKCPIVPVMQLKKSRAFKRNYVLIGKPFELSEYYEVKLTDDIINQTNSIIRKKMEETYAHLLEIIRSKKNKKINRKNSNDRFNR